MRIRGERGTRPAVLVSGSGTGRWALPDAAAGEGPAAHGAEAAAVGADRDGVDTVGRLVRHGHRMAGRKVLLP